MSLIANVECDEILYRAAFSTEKQAYKLKTTNKITDLGTKYTATQIHSAMKKRGLSGLDYALVGYKILIPTPEDALVHAKHTIKLWIEKIKEHCPKYNLWLSTETKTNFRYKKAVTPRIVNGQEIVGYKAGRPTKPLHYTALREYLIKHQGAKEFKGGEADDALGINKGLMCHIDKDINMVAGEHLNWVDDTRYIVEDGLGCYKVTDSGKYKPYGLLCFYHQLLVGDSTDNIPGLKNSRCIRGNNFGPKTAFEVLKDCKQEKEVFNIIRDLYFDVYKEQWKQKLFEIADLVWIMQRPDEIGSQYIKRVHNV